MNAEQATRLILDFCAGWLPPKEFESRFHLEIAGILSDVLDDPARPWPYPVEHSPYQSVLDLDIEREPDAVREVLRSALPALPFVKPSNQVLHYVEQRLGIELPTSYVELAQHPAIRNYEAFAAAASTEPPNELRGFFDERFLYCDHLNEIRADSRWHRSLLSSPRLVSEWQYPRGLVLLGGDGHTAYGLDYTIGLDSRHGPPVVAVASGLPARWHISDSFELFLAAARVEEALQQNVAPDGSRQPR